MADDDTERWAWLTLGLLALYALTLAGRIQAQDGRLVELVAKVAYNEAGDSYEDLGMIWQVTEARGSTQAERARWLEQHSPCVSGRLPEPRVRERTGRCRWTRYLRADGRLPRGWPGSQRDWHRERPRWLAHLDRARALVRGLDPYRPCAVAPETWDGARWQQSTEARGWLRVECGDTRNAGYVRSVSLEEIALDPRS